MENVYRTNKWFLEDYKIAEKDEAWDILEKALECSPIPIRMFGTKREFTKKDKEELRLFFKYNATKCTFWKKGTYWALCFTNDRFMMLEDYRTAEVA